MSFKGAIIEETFGGDGATDGAASGYSPPDGTELSPLEGAGEEDKPLSVGLLKEKEILESESGTFTVADE